MANADEGKFPVGFASVGSMSFAFSSATIYMDGRHLKFFHFGNSTVFSRAYIIENRKMKHVGDLNFASCASLRGSLCRWNFDCRAVIGNAAGRFP